MSVQRWDIERGAPAWVASKGEFVKHADHARIVAEAGAAVFAFHPEWTVTGMCDSDCLACRRLTELITEREKGYEEGKADAEQAHAAALAEAEHATAFYREVSQLRAADARAADARAAAPRTLTADDPEPAVTSVGLDRDQSVWQRVGSTEHSRWVNPFMGTREWSDVLARGPVRLIHDGEATPQVNMGLRDRDEVENRLSSIRSLMLARPPRTTADALRALADDIQGAAIDGEATPSC